MYYYVQYLYVHSPSLIAFALRLFLFLADFYLLVCLTFVRL